MYEVKRLRPTAGSVRLPVHDNRFGAVPPRRVQTRLRLHNAYSQLPSISRRVFFLHVADRSLVDEKHTEVRRMACTVGGLLRLVGYWTLCFPSVARSFAGKQWHSRYALNGLGLLHPDFTKWYQMY